MFTRWFAAVALTVLSVLYLAALVVLRFMTAVAAVAHSPGE